MWPPFVCCCIKLGPRIGLVAIKEKVFIVNQENTDAVAVETPT